MFEVPLVCTDAQHAMLQQGIWSHVRCDIHPPLVPIEVRITRICTLQAIGVLARRGWRKTDCPLAASSPKCGHPPGFTVFRENYVHVHIVKGVCVYFP